MKRTVVGREKGDFFFLTKSFHAFTKLTIRFLAIAAKSIVSGGSTPAVAINTNLFGSSAMLLHLSENGRSPPNSRAGHAHAVYPLAPGMSRTRSKRRPDQPGPRPGWDLRPIQTKVEPSR